MGRSTFEYICADHKSAAIGGSIKQFGLAVRCRRRFKHNKGSINRKNTNFSVQSGKAAIQPRLTQKKDESVSPRVFDSTSPRYSLPIKTSRLQKMNEPIPLRIKGATPRYYTDVTANNRYQSLYDRSENHISHV